MAITTWMIYGAYGYTGRLIAAMAKQQGLTPVVAGRNPQATQQVADDFGLPARVFALDDPGTLQDNLQDIDAVIHCAGPFSSTSRPMLDACLEANTHYFDITGEISVFEAAHCEETDQRARDAGILVCPGVGFDVIPTDCVAKALQDAMPNATHLSLGFAGGTAPSRGTAKTMVEAMARHTVARRNGVIRNIKIATRSIDYDDGEGPKQSMTIPWGDVSTAYYTTGIENIDVYWPASDAVVRQARIAEFFCPLLRPAFVQDFLKARFTKSLTGPSEKERAASRMFVWGEVRNARGETKVARLKTQNGYDVTTTGPIAIVKHLLANDVPQGSITPALLMGADFVCSLPGSSEILVS